MFGNPLHPYTRMLLASVPRLRTKWEASTVGPQARAAEVVGGADGQIGALVEVERDHLVATASPDGAERPRRRR